MSEQTGQLQNKASEALLTMLDITVKSVGDVVEWGSQQNPEVIHQLLMWKALDSLISFLLPFSLAVFLLSGFLVFGIKFHRRPLA